MNFLRTEVLAGEEVFKSGERKFEPETILLFSFKRALQTWHELHNINRSPK